MNDLEERKAGNSRDHRIMEIWRWRNKGTPPGKGCPNCHWCRAWIYARGKLGGTMEAERKQDNDSDAFKTATGWAGWHYRENVKS